MSSVAEAVIKNVTAVANATSSADVIAETPFEYYSDTAIGLAFLGTTLVAAQRMLTSQSQTGAETTVVTAFYSLILVTAFLRTVWFLIPSTFMGTSYTPVPVMAFESEGWLGNFLSEVLLCGGSLCLFSIFILILVYWADILKKYFHPGSRRSKPMTTFVSIVALLAVLLIANALFFLLGVYSTEGMILVNACVLASVSVTCVFQISIFSHRFRTVLKTLGAINQVSTESQVKRIVWITVTGNLFFVTRAIMEVAFAWLLIYYWIQNGNVAKAFSHRFWDTYVLVKYLSEFAILCLMLYILKSRFSTSNDGRGQYEEVDNAEDEEDLAGNVVVV